MIDLETLGWNTKNPDLLLRAEVVTIVREKAAKAMLCDVGALKGPNEITTAYFRARSVPQEVKRLPCAIVELSGNSDYQSFYETTAANAGLTMKYFTDIEAARAWLRSRLEEMRRRSNNGPVSPSSRAQPAGLLRLGWVEPKIRIRVRPPSRPRLALTHMLTPYNSFS